jgi:hypothetical protein
MSLKSYPIPALPLRWLYVDFNSYFASVEQQLRPELRGKPIAVVAVETDSTSAIAASYEAKAFGVKTGTRIHEAKRLCPGLVCVLARHECYVEFHHRLIEEIEPHIPVTAVCSIDEVACRLMDNENSLERSTAIARAIKNGIADNRRCPLSCWNWVAASLSVKRLSRFGQLAVEHYWCRGRAVRRRKPAWRDSQSPYGTRALLPAPPLRSSAAPWSRSASV